ncbi:MAG: GNAT family N-acetyltransferase, partial [Oscillospiraceae bacterium]|nr:GNAT family N-acetyltransferase [Oscillospiraceae bacterium]
KLVLPSLEYADEIMAYKKDFLEAESSMDGCSSLRRTDDPKVFIDDFKRFSSEETVPEGRVPATVFLCVRKDDNRLLGMLQVRHRFNEYLEKYSGHIGYSVRPSERRNGYAKKMLSLALPFCKDIGINRVLISCIDGNIASEKTILANGGVYESTVYESGENIYLKRFWIDL